MDKGHTKKIKYEKYEFNDPQIADEIRDDVIRINEKQISQLQRLQQINDLYNKHVQAKKMNKIRVQKIQRRSVPQIKRPQNSSQSDQQGEIDQKASKAVPKQSSDYHIQLYELIRKITLTRKKVIELLNSRKFQDLLKGCFVRYISDSNSKNDSDSYIIAQIIGIAQGKEQYPLSTPDNKKTKMVLKLQQRSDKVIMLPIKMVSNQSKKQGNLQVHKWKCNNLQNIPKEKQFRQKIEQLNRLLTQNLSSAQIDKNIETRAILISKGEQQPREDIQNLIDFICEKIDNIQALQSQQISKRKSQQGDLLKIRHQKRQYQQIRNSLEHKKTQFFQTYNKRKESIGQEKTKKMALKIQEKREDLIRDKVKLKKMMLGTAEGYDKIKNTMKENHQKYDYLLDF